MDNKQIYLHKHSFDYVTMYMWIAEMEDLSLNDKLILSKIYGYCKSNNKKFYGTVKYLSKQTAMSTRSVSSSLKSLLDKNLIIRYDESNPRSNAKYSYTINESEIFIRTGLNLDQINRITIDSLRHKIKDFELEIQKYSNDAASNEAKYFSYDYIFDATEPEFSEKDEDAGVKVERKPIVMDFTVSQKDGFLKSKNNKPKPKRKENKFTQFASYARQCNYSDRLMDIVLKYIKWLLGNRKVDLEQWKATIDNLNSELLKIGSMKIREEAAIDAFSVAYAAGYQKISIDKYKYSQYMNNKFIQDNQTSNSTITETSSGVYEVVGTKQDFVTDENGNIVTF